MQCQPIGMRAAKIVSSQFIARAPGHTQQPNQLAHIRYPVHLFHWTAAPFHIKFPDVHVFYISTLYHWPTSVHSQRSCQRLHNASSSQTIFSRRMYNLTQRLPRSSHPSHLPEYIQQPRYHTRTVLAQQTLTHRVWQSTAHYLRRPAAVSAANRPQTFHPPLFHRLHPQLPLDSLHRMSACQQLNHFFLTQSALTSNRRSTIQRVIPPDIFGHAPVHAQQVAYCWPRDRCSRPLIPNYQEIQDFIHFSPIKLWTHHATNPLVLHALNHGWRRNHESAFSFHIPTRKLLAAHLQPRSKVDMKATPRLHRPAVHVLGESPPETTVTRVVVEIDHHQPRHSPAYDT